MRQQEFESRVLVQVSTEEYVHIEQVYMNSDLDKDEFCKLWRQMNRTRVNEAIEKSKARKVKEEQNEKLWYIVSKYEGKSYNWLVENFANDALGKREKAVLNEVGIEIEQGYSRFKDMMSVIYEVRQYLKAA